MHVVDQIFEAFGNSPTQLSNATGIPVQTVCDWRTKGRKEIPNWRRSVILGVAEGRGMPPEALEYLMSDERAPEQAA